MTADRGLEVIVPRRFDHGKIPELVRGKRDWIERAVARVEVRAEAQRRRLEAEPPVLPERIALPAMGEEWEVEYRCRRLPGRAATRGVTAAGASATTGGAAETGCAAAARVVVRERPGCGLVVTGDLDDFEACRRALCRWLSRRARRELVPRLAEIAQRHRLEYGRVSVRQQRTRWASCSRRKTISLNARLLFLPPDLVDYVLTHELCHTVEMNHSPRFWTLLGYHDPECRVHRRLLRTAGGSIPTWLDHEAGEPGV